ncbi:hypothetical protein F5B21DRAFT_500451 [Xylaria acuta]|nr:hypothetical protein F5B21DRAFT_500451 [Xylaria acuta]
MASKQKSKYWMDSEGERKRLASNHFTVKDGMGGKLVRAPVDFSRPVKILDSGTADDPPPLNLGTWLLDLASSLPPLSAGTYEFASTDLNPAPFPQLIPPNVTFTVQDMKKPWPKSQHGRLDLVHQHPALLSAGPNPSASVSYYYSIVKPGGWV